MVLFSCGKEEAIDPIFVEKEFFIENPETATARVLDFLSYTDLTETTLRSDYPDTEVNEGLWTLEASRNYIDNVNLSYKSDITINYTLSIVNIVDNGVIKMSGADMTDKFNELQADIAAEEASGKTAKIADFKLQNVSIQQTDLTIGVVYSLSPPPPPPAGCEDWPASQSIWISGATLENCLLNHTIGYAWYQTIELYGYDDLSICFDIELYENCQCMWEGFGDMDPDKFDDAYLAAQDMIHCLILDSYGPPPPSDESHQYGTNILLVDIELVGNGLSTLSAIFCNKVVLGRGIPI